MNEHTSKVQTEGWMDGREVLKCIDPLFLLLPYPSLPSSAASRITRKDTRTCGGNITLI